MSDEGKLIGPNFQARLLNVLPWAETQKGQGPTQHQKPPQILGQTSETRIPFLAKSDVPAYGVIAPYLYDVTSGSYAGQLVGNADSWYLTCDAPTTHGIDVFNTFGVYTLPITWSAQYINGSTAVSAGEKGWCYAAAEKPRWALINPEMINSQSTAYMRYPTVGAVIGSNYLHAGLPGFRVLGPFAEIGSTTQALVQRDWSGGGWAIAKGDWTDGDREPFVQAYPITTPDTTDAFTYRVYDGVDLEPEIRINIALPRNGTDRDPNVQTDNVIAYHQHAHYPDGSSSGFVAAGSYLDDKIGTVKFWAGATVDIPQGWRKYASVTEGDFIRHHDSTAGGTGTFGTTGSDYAYRNLITIERFE
jgi:hypothetical protein